MAFKIEDLMFSITVEAENEAVMRLNAGEDVLMEVMFASCGKTQFLPCVGDLNLANAAAGMHVAFRPKSDNLKVLRGELEDALKAVIKVQADLAAQPQHVDEKSLVRHDKGEGETASPS